MLTKLSGLTLYMENMMCQYKDAATHNDRPGAPICQVVPLSLDIHKHEEDQRMGRYKGACWLRPRPAESEQELLENAPRTQPSKAGQRTT